MRSKIKRYFDKFYRLFSNDIGIDLGTANTLVYLRGRGIVINEPSVVAVNQKTGRVVAVGTQAKEMLGRTPGHITAVRPLVDGVISDFEVTEEMLSYLINKAQMHLKKVLRPRVVIGVPSGITSVETRAVRDAAKNAGAREVHIVEEPMAATIGIRLPVTEPIGNMIIDIGGGTSDIAVVSLNGIVRSKNVRIAGDKFDSDIISYIRSEFKILIGEKTAEDLKIAACAVLAGEMPIESVVRGRDLVTGLPREVVITDSDIREAISNSVDHIIDATREVLETTPPEVLSDVMQRGAYVVGGGALINGMPELLHDTLKLPVYIADDPMSAVVRGTGIILEDIDAYDEILLESDDEQLSPTS
ncbi:MAG: rod shape-determining protein [Candidatus Pacebacteria bacterium]|jgi:rod shape-determining protein MreB|nr:rod shape-determining protein [Parcubacteria group bacterium]MDP6249235.1 rod shape-determining protein [Candidatus Paceibacterota bacterium]MDP7159043.1 rod shape-determining protein [Candidatus Paceibacterota bacterium]MDP7366623.1 rod shape-determining protein [Candidatus Paceibacterota bacterium]MDP7466093.1 rod shape-determining protein [Candidatus Paceibacterota bacterium]|tara:strand:+ start:719 stop:1795 length:1077 start_codon:yes stop_codon:yes gene_type:complete